MDQSPRIEAVLQIIKYMREPHTVMELADKMNTTYRSVYRYIDARLTSSTGLLIASVTIISDAAKAEAELKKQCILR